MAMEFTLTHPDSGIKDILVIFDGVPYEADSDHPWWDEIIRLCLADDPRVLDLFPIRPVQQPSEEVPFDEARAAYEQARAEDPTVFGGQDAEEEDLTEAPRWLPHNIEREDDEDEDEAEARAEAREGEHTAHEIIEEGS